MGGYPGLARGPSGLSRVSLRGRQEGQRQRRRHDEGRRGQSEPQDAALEVEGAATAASGRLREPPGAGTGEAADFPPALLKGRGPADPSVLALKTHPGLRTRRTGRSVCVPRVTERGCSLTGPLPRAPLLTGSPAWGVFPHLTPAGSVLAVLQARLFQEAFRAHLAESPPPVDADPPHLGTESFRAMVSDHVKNHLRTPPKKSWCLGSPPLSIKQNDGAWMGFFFFFKPRYSSWAARAEDSGGGAFRFVPIMCVYAVSAKSVSSQGPETCPALSRCFINIC